MRFTVRTIDQAVKRGLTQCDICEGFYGPIVIDEYRSDNYDFLLWVCEYCRCSPALVLEMVNDGWRKSD